MAKCMSCGKTILFTSNFGNIVLCKNCGSTINISVWENRNFSTLDELIAQKSDAISRATASNISQRIIAEISNYFDEYIKEGFITSINGKAGQTLKIFENHCIITTKSELKKTELENMFYQFDDDDDDDTEIFSSEDKRNLVKGMLSGKLLQSGVGAVVSATINHQEKEKAAEKKSHERHKNISRLITVGERRVELNQISSIEIFSRPNTANGYMKFIKKGAPSNTLYKCEYFFFNNSIPFETKKIKKQLDSIKKILGDRISATKSQRAVPSDLSREHTKEKEKALDIFDEIRKYKELLNEGIITEEEFNIKKKQLLDL